MRQQHPSLLSPTIKTNYDLPQPSPNPTPHQNNPTLTLNTTFPSPQVPTRDSPSPTSPSSHDQETTARLLHRYGLGTLPSPPRRFAHHLKSERKYFDSGDYALSKAGRGDGVDLGAVGVLHPEPEGIPHPIVGCDML
ncbi:hypothetical protein B0T16DRAFT_70902 [Cercophora newfieldiana]|uniref:mRNA stability protein n=1 Tax=Cercophora newfieldiana TaxID=92897 RepID=A0AA39YSS8_9PEZI|nr:hypothetical protein B0T16DRAFT_70902 [Cercophora newfieldiana]